MFSTAGTAGNLSWIARLPRPVGHLSAVDIAPPFDAGPIVTTRLDGLTARKMKAAHALLESRRTIGKIVIVA